MIPIKGALVASVLYVSVSLLLPEPVCGASGSLAWANSRRYVADALESLVQPRNVASTDDLLSSLQTRNSARDLAPAGAELCKVGQPCADGRYVESPLRNHCF